MKKALYISISVFIMIVQLSAIGVQEAQASDAYVWVRVWKNCRSCGYAEKSGQNSGTPPISVSREVLCGPWYYRHTKAYCKVGVKYFLGYKHGYFIPILWVLYPGLTAGCSWYWEDPPETGGSTNVTLALSYGIVLRQNGSSSAFYEISLMDLVANENLYYAVANVTSGDFYATPNWRTQWATETDRGETEATLPPSNITVSVPEGHSFRETHDAIVESHEEDAQASVESVVKEPVGGVAVSVDKFGLLAPYLGLASTIIVATVVAAIYVKRVKRRKEKQ